MGVHMGILEDISIDTINRTFQLVQPAHLQKLEGEGLSREELRVARATFIRNQLAQAN
jgi:protein-arginine kinase